jgi:hypothetical protein
MLGSIRPPTSESKHFAWEILQRALRRCPSRLFLIEKPPDGAVDVDPGEVVERSARFYRTDFVRRDAENRQLGRLGEEWVVEFEQRRLHDEERRPDLARRVEWIPEEARRRRRRAVRVLRERLARREADHRPVEAAGSGAGAAAW